MTTKNVFQIQRKQVNLFSDSIRYPDSNKLTVSFNTQTGASTLIENLYPVGSIFITVEDLEQQGATPAKYFGGTWERFSKGRVLLNSVSGAGYGGTPSRTSETKNGSEIQGGTSTVTLTLNQAPRHRHSTKKHDNNVQGTDNVKKLRRPESYSSSRDAFDSLNAGTSNPIHSNIEPYITCFMWHRLL